MQHRPFVLHICRRDHNPSLVEAVLARAGFGVLPARSLGQAAMQLRRADVIVISSCWSKEEKHTLMAGLRTASTAPLVCVTATPHGCCACTEADPFDPDDLIRAIQHSLAMLFTVHPSRRFIEDESMRLQVSCYAGRKADERPVRFRMDEHEHVVEEVIDQWYGLEDVFFKVRSDDGNVYILRHDTSVPNGRWDLAGFRQTTH